MEFWTRWAEAMDAYAARGADEVVRSAAYAPDAGAFEVSPRTAAVFVRR